MNYFGSTVNSSATIAEKAGAAISDGFGLAVKYDDNGDVVLCNKAGEVAVGILTPESADAAQGEEVTVQIRHIGYAKAGAAVKKGAALAVDATGALIAAAAGNFIVGFAMSTAAAKGDMISVDVCKAGYAAAAGA